MDFSPDGTYFVIVANGGPTGTNGMCDAAARFETANVSATAEPTWINWTGGDSLYSVAITGPAVYVGGHQRWLDNPLGFDTAGPGAVSRPGIGAIDPVTGRALSWNPTKSRNHGTMVLYATPQGLWVGSDGEEFGHEDHAGIGFAPLDPTTDTTDPTITIATPPAGAVYLQNQVVNADFSCADTGGSGLASCVGTVADGQAINTATLGQRTFTVTATDAAGNSQGPGPHLHRRRRPPRRQDPPRHRPCGRQRHLQHHRRRPDPHRHRRPGPDRHVLRHGAERRPRRRTTPAPRPTVDARFTVVYRDPAGANITTAVTNGTYRTPSLATNGTHQIKIVVTVGNAAPNGASMTRTLTAISTTQPTIKDTVRFVTTRA